MKRTSHIAGFTLIELMVALVAGLIAITDQLAGLTPCR